MKFIHTADLHLGNKMHDIDREEEYQSFFAWLRETILAEEAEMVLIAGDVYDTVNPPIGARKIFNRFLASLLDTDCRNVVIVGGNHDSGALLDSNRELMEALNIHLIGSIANRKISELVFPVEDKRGEVVGICAAVPFVKESEMRAYCDETKMDEKNYADKAYSALYRAVLEEAKKVRGDKDIPIVTSGHLYAANLDGRYAGYETEERMDDGVRMLDVIGNLGSVHVGSFPEEFDYVALGHIHYQTMVAKNPKIRYSGSPFVMGFDEANIKHGVLAVDCERGKIPVVKPLVAPHLFKYRRVEGSIEKIKKELKEIIDKYKLAEPDEFDKLFEASEAEAIRGAAETSQAAESNVAGSKYFLEVRYSYEDSGAVNKLIGELDFPEQVRIVSTKLIRQKNSDMMTLEKRTMREMQELDPVDVFSSLILSKLPLSFDQDADDEAKEKARKDAVEKYLPYFMDAFEKVQGGQADEDK